MNNLQALSFAAVTFFGGAALAILFYRLEIKDSATIIALIVAPLLVYGIASGNIIELSAPGGWNAKFKEVAQQNVETTATPLTDGLVQLQSVEKEGIEKLEQIIPTLQKGKPLALVLYFGKQNYYIPSIVRAYIERLQTVDPSLIVVVVDDSTKRFVCTIEADFLKRLSPADFDNAIAAIGNAKRDYLLSISNFVFHGIRSNKTNLDALKKMKEFDTTFLVVLDEKDMPISLVRRNEILAHIFDKLS